MPDDQAQPIASVATLEARIIRACPVHQECPLECPRRQIEELGVIARIDREST